MRGINVIVKIKKIVLKISEFQAGQSLVVCLKQNCSIFCHKYVTVTISTAVGSVAVG